MVSYAIYIVVRNFYETSPALTIIGIVVSIGILVVFALLLVKVVGNLITRDFRKEGVRPSQQEVERKQDAQQREEEGQRRHAQREEEERRREAQEQKARSLPSRKQRRETIPKSVKIFVWQRDEGRCVECGSNERLEYDHIIPVSKGGSNTERNLQLLCQRCNRSKGGSIG